jgi:hypothetical protein
MAHNRVTLATVLTGMLIPITGCESRDERLASYAQQAIDQQARQNEEMARQSQQVALQSGELAKAAHHLVEQDAAARRELIEAQSNLQTQLHDERTRIDVQRQELHAQRQAAAGAAIRAPVIAHAIVVTGLILATLLPLILTAYALRRLPDPGPSESLLAETVIESLAVEHLQLPSSAPPRPLPADSRAPLLGGAPTSDLDVVSSG